MLQFQKAKEESFNEIQAFYWNVIENIHKNNIKHENLGWEKGIYPSDAFIRNSLIRGELYTLTDQGRLYACVILNSEHNEGYDGCSWSTDCDPDQILTPHALAVNPQFQGKGMGKIVVKNIINVAKAEHKNAIRLDVLGACKSAEQLYKSCGFHFVEAKNMYYEDTGWTEYKLFELIMEDNKMDFLEIKPEMFDELTALHKAYKAAIGENAPTDAELQRLRTALEKEQIHFYGCICDHSLVACCSVSFTYSTFNYGKSGVFEDFYIQPDYRHRGIAKKLVSYAYEQSGVESLTVGCADCDVSMYQALGFAIPLGNLLAFGE